MRLIDADALKKRADEVFANDEIEFKDLIDNAPTVPQINVFCENADEKAVADLKAELQSVIESRPQGEWKVVHTATGETKCKCNQCQHFIKIGDDKNFCPNCGADMRGDDK